MSKSINKVILVGRLGRDPELKYTASGVPFCRFSMATDDSWNDKNSGERQERTEWHNIVAWDRLAEICNQYLTKGRQVYIEGSLQTRKYQDNSGAERYSTEIVLQKFRGELTMLGGKGEGGGQFAGGDDYGSSSSYPSGGGRVQPSGAPENFSAELDDEIPF